MRRWISHGAALSLFALSACLEPVGVDAMSLGLVVDDIDISLAYAAQQIRTSEDRLAGAAQPRCTPTDFAGGQWNTSDTRDWRSGFFTGCEWLMYEAFGDDANGWLAKSSARTAVFADEVSRPQTHDVGFK